MAQKQALNIRSSLSSRACCCWGQVVLATALYLLRPKSRALAYAERTVLSVTVLSPCHEKARGQNLSQPVPAPMFS